MSFHARALLLASTAIISLSATGLALSQSPEPRNFVLIIPEALPANGIDQTNAPSLAAMRLEGVTFVNSHSEFPRLAAEFDFTAESDLKARALVAAAAQRYSAAFVQDTRSPDARERSAALQQALAVTLPKFKADKKPFFLAYRIAEPRYVPPSGSEVRPAYKPAPGAADTTLQAIEEELKTLGLFENTNIIVAAEHAYSRILKVSHTSRARVLLPREETLGTLPPGFLAIDVAAALHSDDEVINLFDPDNANAFVDWSSGGHPTQGNAIVVAGYDPLKPLLTIQAHGSYGAIFLADTLPKRQRRYIAHTIIEAMLEQDYLGGVFVNESRVGKFPGALSLTHIIAGRPPERRPDLVIAFASVSTGCPVAVACTSVIADTPLPEGEGIVNAFNRAGTWTFMAARGPDFQAGQKNSSPVSNADIARTLEELMDLDIDPTDRPGARVVRESLVGSRQRAAPRALHVVRPSKASIEGLTTQVWLQTLGSSKYFDTAIPAYVEIPAVVYAPKRKWRWPQWKRITITLSDDDDDAFD